MSLTLVTGPANSGKAGEVIGRYRELLADDGLLIVPRFEDVEHTRRELAGAGVVFGARVVRFARAFDLAAERAGTSAWPEGNGQGPAPRVATPLLRELVMEEAVAGARLRSMARSARGAGFARAALRLVDELQRGLVEPDAFERALGEWGRGGGRGRRAYAAEVAALYAEYRARLDGAGLLDAEVLARRALDALRREPHRWEGTPLLLYGFDDFTTLELDLLETVSRHCGAEVVVSLPHEPGRPAFRATAPTYARLAELAGEEVALAPSDAHYAPEARAALSHVERRLFEPGERALPPPGHAVRLLTAGGERAEAEQVAAQVLALLREGVRPGDVAVVFRDPGRYASLVEQVFSAYGVPFSIHRRVRLAHTALGRGVCALVRCTLPGAGIADLVAYLRTEGRLRAPHLADRLERDVRRAGVTGFDAARDLWEAERWELSELDRLGGTRSTAAFLRELERQVERLFGAPFHRRAHVFDGPEVEDAQAFAAAKEAIRDLRSLAESGARLDRRRVLAALEGAEVHAGDDASPERVRVASPEAVRARRFDAVFVCGLQSGEFPRAGRPEPFLSDEARRELAGHGLALAPREDELEREGYLFYVCCSRAERLVALSTRLTDEEGNPEPRSFLVDEVLELFPPGSVEEAGARRPLAAVTWPTEQAPTAVERERAEALRGPRRSPPRRDGLRSEEVLADLAERDEFSAGALEVYAGCGVRWVVERLIEPVSLEPDPEPLVRGQYAHSVLRLTFERLRERTGNAAVTAANLPMAEELLVGALREKGDEFRLTTKGSRVRALARRLEFDLVRHLRHEAEAGSRFAPRELELAFGLAREDELGLPAVDLGAGGIRLRGRIDRVDACDGHAVVRDYKSGKTGRLAVAKWEEENRLQAALYMLAVREVLGLEPVAGLYVPLGGTDRSPRGVVAEEWAEAVGSDLAARDVRPAEEVQQLLERAREKVVETVGRLRSGEATPCPESCGFDGRCSYPSVCREEGR